MDGERYNFDYTAGSETVPTAVQKWKEVERIEPEKYICKCHNILLKHSSDGFRAGCHTDYSQLEGINLLIRRIINPPLCCEPSQTSDMNYFVFVYATDPTFLNFSFFIFLSWNKTSQLCDGSAFTGVINCGLLHLCSSWQRGITGADLSLSN